MTGDRRTRLEFSPPFLGEEEIAEVAEVLRSGWISRGPRTRQFEAAFAEYLGAPAALGLSSCTAGLHLALIVLDIGPGDEVIVTTMTFCSTANAVEHVGARPVLVDVEVDTLNIDPTAVENAITERTKAIMVVHYGGHPADLNTLQAMADRHGLAVVEDAAHSLPARYEGRTVGATPNLTSFSFYATKNLTTGEGGMLTGDPALVDRARVLSLHGIQTGAWDRHAKGGTSYYEVVAPGYKYNMTDLEAALGMCQLKKLDCMQARRREIVEVYQEGLADLEGLELPSARHGVDPAWHLFPIRVRPDVLGRDRDQLVHGLTEQGIGTSVHFIPLHVQPYYREKYGLTTGDFPVAHDAFERLVTVPLHPGLSDEDGKRIVDAIRKVICVGN